MTIGKDATPALLLDFDVSESFVMKGNFEADLYTKIDYSDLDNMQLLGKVGIDGCQVLKAPEEVTDLAGPGSLTQIVEIPSLDKNAPPGANTSRAKSAASSTRAMIFR